MIHATTTPDVHELLREIHTAKADAERREKHWRAALEDNIEADHAWQNDTMDLIDQQREVIRVLGGILERTGADVPARKAAA